MKKFLQPQLFTAAVSREQQEKNAEKELALSKKRAAQQRDNGPATPVDNRSATAKRSAKYRDNHKKEALKKAERAWWDAVMLRCV